MDAITVSSWQQVCQPLSSAFTAPTFCTFLHIVAGWVLCRTRPHVTQLVCVVGTRLLGHAAKHWTTYERFFYRARWDLKRLSGLLLGRVVVPLVLEQQSQQALPMPQAFHTLDLNLDDTTAARRGKHVAFAGFFRDASAGHAMKKVVHWSHNWIIGAVALPTRRWPGWCLSLPVLFALYRKPQDCSVKEPFATRQVLAGRMIRQAAELLAAEGSWQIRVAADGQYATRAVVQATLESRSVLVSRIKTDAALYALPPRHRGKRKRGGQRRRGKRLPTPPQMAARRRKGWRTIQVNLYGKLVKRRVLAVICLWWYVAKEHSIKLLIVRDPKGRQKDQFLFSTDAQMPDEQLLERFADRWPIEVSIGEAKQSLGFEQVQGWCPKTVLRQAPLALVIQTLVKVWYVRFGADAPRRRLPPRPWREPPAHPSYLDMLATLREVLWESRFNLNTPLPAAFARVFNLMRYSLCSAR